PREEQEDPDGPAVRMAWQSLGSVTNFETERGSATLTCGAAVLRLTQERAGIIRVRLAPGGAFPQVRSWAVVPAARAARSARHDADVDTWRAAESAAGLTLATDEITIRIE